MNATGMREFWVLLVYISDIVTYSYLKYRFT